MHYHMVHRAGAHCPRGEASNLQEVKVKNTRGVNGLQVLLVNRCYRHPQDVELNAHTLSSLLLA